MCDGYYSNRDGLVVLCTDSFSFEDTLVLMNVLINKFKLNCRTEPKGANFRIVIKKSSIKDLQSLVAKYIIPSIQYKIGMNIDYIF
jgi:hypothetical protein